MATKKTEKVYKVLTRRELLLMRDEAVRKEFDKHTRVKHLDATYVVHEILQVKFFLDADCLWRIVRDTYRRKYHKE